MCVLGVMAVVARVLGVMAVDLCVLGVKAVVECVWGYWGRYVCFGGDGSRCVCFRLCIWGDGSRWAFFGSSRASGREALSTLSLSPADAHVSSLGGAYRCRPASLFPVAAGQSLHRK